MKNYSSQKSARGKTAYRAPSGFKVKKILEEKKDIRSWGLAARFDPHSLKQAQSGKKKPK